MSPSSRRSRPGSRSSTTGGAATGAAAGRAKLAAVQAAHRRAERRRRMVTIAGVVLAGAALVAAIVAVALTRHPAHAAAGIGPEGVVMENGTPLASADTAATGHTVDGIKCGSTESVAYHIHARLAVYVTGQLRPIPMGIGIGPPLQVSSTPAGSFVSSGSCFSWLHTHAADGIIHVESPTNRVYTLGNFFDVWGEPLSTTQVGPAHGPVTAYVNGVVFPGDPRSIPLSSHEVIQLDVGTPLVPPQPVTIPSSL
ncbi:MAG TPA: hypothetical protein VNE21_06095 [Mycobacteriales bacterium]|nr:hypothetical protein [Mycobacteriales bacterium]